jgi:hypothetical protein
MVHLNEVPMRWAGSGRGAQRYAFRAALCRPETTFYAAGALDRLRG